VFNISNFTREDNPSVRGRRTTMTGFDTWTMIATYSRSLSSGIRARTFLAVSAGVIADRLTSFPRRVCDQLFMINDAEAGWQGWQVFMVRGGFGRRYRDPGFDTTGMLDEVR
jgi:hypothetical protein